MSDGAAGPVRRSGVALAIVTAAFSAMLLSANLATPLYAVWARQFGFSTAVLVIGIGLVAVATTLFTTVTTFAAVTGGGALALAAWHLRNRGGTAGQRAQAADRREGSLVRSGQGT